MKKLLIFLLILTSCNTSKETVTSTTAIPKPTHLQPDTCLTDKQLKAYYKFVKDSLKIELRRDKQTSKKEIDSLKIELKMLRSDNSVIKYVTRFDTKRFNDSITKVRQMYSDSLKSVVKINTSDNRAKKTEIRQDKRTERTQARQKSVWLFVLVALVLIFILGVISKFRLF